MSVINQQNCKRVLVKFVDEDRKIIKKVYEKLFPDAAKNRFFNIISHPNDFVSYSFSSNEAYVLAKTLQNVIGGTEDEPVLILSDALLNFIEETPKIVVL